MKCLLVLLALVAGQFICFAADAEKPGFTDTPLVPGTKWHIHDPQRPQPTVVTPGKEPGQPPADAIVLFDGKDLSKWRTANGKEAPWKIGEGEFECVPKSGNIFTRESFGDIQLHLEFATPIPVKGNSQDRGNSGIFLMNQFELQILDAYNNPTYADGTLGAQYGQHPPLVNVARLPGEWQAYDIVFTVPRFKDGKLEKPAHLTAFLNDVLIHNHDPYFGPTGHKSIGRYVPSMTNGPIRLQDHGNTTRFRNIWIRRLDGAAIEAR
jgi:hypothetical protein